MPATMVMSLGFKVPYLLSYISPEIFHNEISLISPPERYTVSRLHILGQRRPSVLGLVSG